ncbi:MULTISPECIES: sulfotransferase family protein [unclassified Schlesneria]|uniref:sulfotransferase family protein n=1 Tax=unclassified Schlesneria TaxID=2762017 RepID=UPI002EDDF3FF
MKIDFIVPGFSKCGTTSLCAMLAEHPEIGIPNPHDAIMKEPSFFANEYHRGWDSYWKLFDGVAEKRLHGEGSTVYSTEEYGEVVVDRLMEYFPDIRLIFIARDPFARLESSFREMHDSGYKYGIEPPARIDEALRTLPNMLKDTLYWQRIQTFRRKFSDSQIKVMFLEDLERDPATELARCFEFLGVDPGVQIESTNIRLNSGQSKRQDSKVLHFLKSNRFASPCWNQLPEATRNWMMKRLGLRQKFRSPIEWPAATRAWVLEQVGDDARQFLEFYGKPTDFWRLQMSLFTTAGQKELPRRRAAA